MLRVGFIFSFIVFAFFKQCPSVQEGIKREREKTTKLAEERISKDKELAELDTLCKTIPTPKEFILVGKSTLESEKFVRYEYANPLEYEEIKIFYVDWFSQNGWNPIEPTDVLNSLVIYEKDGYEVSLQPLGDPCRIKCAKYLPKNR